MKKVIPNKIMKVWGYELWLYSPVLGMETKLENGLKITEGPLIKIIQANRPLSIQVHPDDIWAKELENENNGKSESWFILDHKKDSSLILGLNNYDKKTIRKQIQNNLFEDNLLFKKVKKNDFYNIPAGLVHGIGANIKVLEVQQASDITYRYYDYNRLENGEPRELHIEKALKVQKQLDYKLKPISHSPLIYKNSVGTQQYMNTPSILKNDSIIIDIENENAYIAKKGEKISFKDYCIISY